MSARAARAAEFLRANAVGLGVGLALIGGGTLAIRWVGSARAAPPPPRKVMQFTTVALQPPPSVKPPPPPPVQPREEEPVQNTRVNLKPSEFTQPDLSRPAAAAGGGRLSLAAEGAGAGDAFNLAGNPGGRGLLSGGGLGDGSGDPLGEGGGGNHFGWYYTRIAGEIEAAFRRAKALSAAATRVELRVWADPDGRISRIELVRSTGDARLDQAIQSVVGMRLSEPPPRDIPMPMVARLTARRVAQ